MRGTLFLIFASVCAAQAQPVDNSLPSFEVASVRAATLEPSQMRRVSRRGGPGSEDPTRITWENASLSNLISEAYSISFYQLTAPAWIHSAYFNISAKLPPGTTKEQARLMVQSLLIERFRLQVHRESKETQVYDLVVGKNGHKMKESVEEPPKDPGSAAPSAAPARLTADKEGYPLISPGGMAIMNGRARWMPVKVTMDVVASRLGISLQHPVTNSTGLTGKYDFTLSWDASAGSGAPSTAPQDDVGPTLERAVQEQLGLKLEPKKGSVDVVVVDHVEKVPTEN